SSATSARCARSSRGCSTPERPTSGRRCFPSATTRPKRGAEQPSCSGSSSVESCRGRDRRCVGDRTIDLRTPRAPGSTGSGARSRRRCRERGRRSASPKGCAVRRRPGRRLGSARRRPDIRRRARRAWADRDPRHQCAISGFVPFEAITLEDWSRTLSVNLTGTFNCLQSAIPDMAAAGWGRILTISSAAGTTGAPRQGHYSASKGGVIALTKTVALEYAEKGITANTIPPFTVDTPMLRAAQDSRYLPSADVLARMVPARRLGTCDDIAAVCAFLCSDDAGYITGQV